MSLTSGLAPIPPLAVLPLPPHEYDPVYFMTLIQNLTFTLQQLTNPGLILGSGIALYSNTQASSIQPTRVPTFLFNTTDSNTNSTLVLNYLPEGSGTPPAGLQPYQVWIDTSGGAGMGLLRINTP